LSRASAYNHNDRRGAAFRAPLSRTICGMRGALRNESRFSCGSLERVPRLLDVQPPMAWLGFRGVAVVAHEIRCSRFWAGHALTTRTANATPLRGSPSVAALVQRTFDAPPAVNSQPQTLNASSEPRWVTGPILGYPIILRVVDRGDLPDISRQEIQVIGVGSRRFYYRVISLVDQH
jgi:hypothetical protein